MRYGKNNEKGCRTYAEMIALLNGNLTKRTAAIPRHIRSCPRCAFAFGLLEQLLCEELTPLEKELLDSVRPGRRLKKLRRIAKTVA